MRLGNKIRMIRELKGVSQEAVAIYLDISPQAYGKIEREETKLDFDRLENIANYLSLSVEQILGFNENKLLGSKDELKGKIASEAPMLSENGKIIERLLITLEARFNRYDILLERNLDIIERFGELINSK
ncbi:helix-turn-helix transcriptional regulator [Flectobacillus sp. DC10W]|uniref:Helix-turn-helix transcriptional regulator n=1 Tax=Flectobacillus longus TaxID=2984207 RepID=A0ABT6YRT3_9BACT|nr:helix-turn-helix transcriptional regulator [Flectobacillus longus]MDI9865843.1 helix-turn-helix transcriptional regulator [Flectobacillus longus]